MAAALYSKIQLNSKEYHMVLQKKKWTGKTSGGIDLIR